MSVFVSHTSDMATFPPGRSFVQAAVDGVLKAGATPVDMAYFASRDSRSADYCQQQVRRCDVYMAVVGFRYGSLVRGLGGEVSYTDLEFRTASESGLPRLVFLLDEEALIPVRMVDFSRTAITEFRHRLATTDLVHRTFVTADALEAAVLHAIKELSDEPAGDGSPGGLRQPSMAPPLDRVVERPELSVSLLAALSRPTGGDVGLSTSLHGAGGFGKTSLVTWVCHRPEIRNRYSGGILWATVGRDLAGVDLAERVNDLSFALVGRRPPLSDPRAAGAELGRLLDTIDRPSLLVVDDVWDSEQLEPFRYGGKRCTRLITTRIPDVLPVGCTQIEVDAMSVEESRELVLDGIGNVPADMVTQLTELTGRWPVLLNLVNGVLASRIRRGQSREAAAEKIIDSLRAMGPTAFDPARPRQREKAVAATVEASLEMMELADRDRYLDLAIFPEDVAVPVDVLDLIWPGRQADDLCETFLRLGLAADYRLDAPGPRLILHDVMRAFVRSRRAPAEHQVVHERLVDATAGLLARNSPGESTDQPSWWELPPQPVYLWRYLPFHLAEAGRSSALDRLVCDLRWVEAKTRLFDSSVTLEADLALSNCETAQVLRRALAQASHVLGNMDPPSALKSTVASRVGHIPFLASSVREYLAQAARPVLRPSARLPDLPRREQLRVCAGHDGAVLAVAFSPRDGIIASVGEDRTVRLWTITDGTATTVFTGHRGWVSGLAFSPDGSVLASSASDRTIRLWSVSDGSVDSVLTGHVDAVHQVAFSPDGRLLASAGDDRTVRVWDVATRSAIHILLGHTGGVYGVSFAPNGELLASGGTDRTVRVWDVATGELVKTMRGHSGSVWDVRFSADGRLASAGADGTVRVWDPATGAESLVLSGRRGSVSGIRFSPVDKVLVSAGADGVVRLWDLATGSERAALTGHTSLVWDVDVSPDGRRLLSAGADGTVRIWDLLDGDAQESRQGRDACLVAIAFAPDGEVVATAGENETLMIADIDGDAPQVLAGHMGTVSAIAFSPDGQLLASAGADRSVRLWGVTARTATAVLAGHDRRIADLAFSPDGRLLASAGEDETVRLKDVATGRQLAVLTGHTGPVTAIDFSRDGRFLASAGTDRLIRVLPATAESHDRGWVLDGHEAAVRAVRFSPDGHFLVSSGDDETVRWWDVADAAQRAVLAGHVGPVPGVDVSADGRFAVSVGMDRTLRVWSLANPADGCICAVRVAGRLFGVRWHPDCTRIGAVGECGYYLFTVDR